MRTSIVISKRYHQAYIPRDMIEQGYHGEVEMLANAVTITLVKPKTSLEDVRRSLEITLQDIDLRMKQEEKDKVE